MQEVAHHSQDMFIIVYNEDILHWLFPSVHSWPSCRLGLQVDAGIMVFELEEQFPEFMVINKVFLYKNRPESFLQASLPCNQSLQLKLGNNPQPPGCLAKGLQGHLSPQDAGNVFQAEITEAPAKFTESRPFNPLPDKNAGNCPPVGKT